jgi:hypothetical protein
MTAVSQFSHRFSLFFITIAAITLVFLPHTGKAQTTTYPIVDTGQSACYNSAGAAIACPAQGEAFYGQDAQHSGNTPSYTDNGNGTITDNVTGLMWQQSADTNGDGDIGAADKLTYAEAGTYCNSLTLAGYTDWRLPDIKQLYSLIDFSGIDPSGYNGADTSGLIPFIDTDYFDFAYGDTSAGERVIDAQYASSTLYVSNTANDGGSTMFGVNFADGRIKGYGLTLFGQDKTFFVICVRGNINYGQNDFVDNGDSTITDSATGLMWAQDDSGAGLNWEEALAWVEQKNNEKYLGYNDWRLPNAKELQSIVDYNRSPDTTGSGAISPLFNVTGITNEAGQADYPFYWTGTTHANWTNTPGAFGVYVAFGRAMGYMNNTWVDVHGAGAQRSDPKRGDPADWPTGHGPQGDAIRIYNYVRLVRDADGGIVVPPGDREIYLPLILADGSTTTSPAFTIDQTLSDEGRCVIRVNLIPEPHHLNIGDEVPSCNTLDLRLAVVDSYYKTSKIEMLRSWARWSIHSLMSAGGGGTSPAGRRSRYSAPVEQAVAHSPQPTQRAWSTSHTQSGIDNAANWQRSRQSPQAEHSLASTTARKSEWAMAVGMPNSAIPRITPQQQVQQLQI